MIESAIPFVTDLIREYGPLVLFLVAFFENAAFLGWVVPGEKLLLAAGYFVQ